MRRSLTIQAAVVATLVGASGCRRNSEAEKPAPAPAPAPAAAAPDKATLAGNRMAEIVKKVEGAASLGAMNAEEKALGSLRKHVLRPWVASFKAKDAVAFTRLLASDAKSVDWTSGRTPGRTQDGIVEHAWKPTAASGERAAAATSEYLSTFAKVEAFEFIVTKVKAAENRIEAELAFDLRGLTAGGARRNDRGTLSVSAVSVEGTWRVAALTVGAAESLEASGSRTPAFVDATASVGLDKVAIVDRREALRRGGYALATADYDSDGRVDVLVGNWGPLKLYRNSPTGFVDVTQAAGLRDESLVKSAAFADFDNDGKKDLIVLRFVDKEMPGPEMPDPLFRGHEGRGDVSIYRNSGDGKFEFKGNLLASKDQFDRTMPVAVADFDGNGTLDLYVGYPGSRDFTNALDQTDAPSDLRKQGLWLNDGKWKFSEAPATSAVTTDKGVYPHAALATDLDGDLKADLIVVDDSGRPNPVYRNEGNGVLRSAPGHYGAEYAGWGMGVAAGDVDGDGRPDLLMTNIVFSDDIRHRTSKAEGVEKLLSGEGRGIVMFKQGADQQFKDATAAAGLDWAGEAPAGVELVDYDSDGDLDIYVMNGLWSGGEEEGISSLFARLMTLRESYGPGETDPAMSLPRQPGDPNPMLSLLREFRGSLDNPAGPAVSEKPTLSIAGNQRNRLFRNNGAGTFTEVGYFENADRTEDGYVAAVADLDGDGRQDLVLRNADPAPGYTFPTVVFLKNTGKNQALTVYARGKETNRDGIGAVITATVGSRTIVREIRSATGAVQSEPAVSFGLAGAPRVDKLVVRWPSGRVEEFKGVKPGRVELREGEGYVVLAAR